jgi:hypothetical protein
MNASVSCIVELYVVIVSDVCGKGGGETRKSELRLMWYWQARRLISATRWTRALIMIKSNNTAKVISG